MHVWFDSRTATIEDEIPTDIDPSNDDPVPSTPSEEPAVLEPHPIPRHLEITPLLPVTAGHDRAEPAGESILAPLDSLGLGTFTYEPAFPRGSILVRGGAPNDLIESRIWLRDLPSSSSVASANRLPAPGDTFDIQVVLRQPNRPVFIDVWNDGRWLSAHSGRVRGEKEKLGVPLPEDIRGLVMIRAGLRPHGGGSFTFAWVDESETPGRKVASLARALAALPLAPPLADYPSRPPPPDPLISRLATTETSVLEAISDREARRAAAAMLSRVEPAERGLPLLGDTTGAKLLALDAWKHEVRRPILAGLVLVAGATILSAGWLVVSYQRRVRQRLTELDLEETDDPDEEAGSITHGGWLAQSAVLVIVLVGAIVGLIVFLETLRWNRGDVFAARQRDAAAEAATLETETD